MKRLRERIRGLGTLTGIILVLALGPITAGIGLWLLSPDWTSWKTYVGLVLLFIAAS